MAAARLAAAGLDTVILDEKLAWEKPCGGGITYKAYRQYPFLLDNPAPKRTVTETTLTDPHGGSVTMRLAQPLLIYARLDLNQLLLDRAAQAGAQLEKERVTGLERKGAGWQVKTRAGALEADHLVVATGARNSFREVGTEWTATDAMCAIGYWVPGEQERIDIQFFSDFEGYLWVFPRCGHLSVGICGKGEPTAKMRARMEQYMAEHGISMQGAKFYAHVIPALEKPSWRRNRTSGEGWMAVGDAAGLVDPVTGEGLYYAIRSGDLAAETILNDAHAPQDKPRAYGAALQQGFVDDLTFGAGLAKRFYSGQLLRRGIPSHMIALARRNEQMRAIMQDLYAGTQTYSGLRQRVMDGLGFSPLGLLIRASLACRAYLPPRLSAAR